MADEKKPRFTEKERYLLGVQQRRDIAEFYPDGPEARWLRERARLAEVNPEGPEARQLREEAGLAELYSDRPEVRQLQEQIREREGVTNVTPEEKQRVDQALGNVQLSDQIGGASDVGAKPVPNGPTPLEKSREIGQDLNRAGVKLDQDK
jgi:hypothetical protein